MTINAYPLTWPAGWKRTVPASRFDAKFGKRQATGSSSFKALKSLSVADGVARVLEQLKIMGIDREDIVISTNLKLRLDGLPRSDQARPADPGVAVYWREGDKPALCMAIDQYHLVEENLAAVAATLDAMRAIHRHGGGTVLERAFTGFQALPAPGAEATWWDVLELGRNCTLADAQDAYRRLRSKQHPDKPGGSHEAVARLNKAWAEAQEAFR